MRIRAIELENFRNFASFQLPFDQSRTLLIGPNGAGKSTLIDAIAWCLTGRCRGVNARGEGQRDLIRLGADEAKVEIDLGGMVVNRFIGRNGSSGSSLKTEQILGQLGTTEGMLRAVLYGRTFFELHHGDAKALLMDALDVTVPASELPGVDLPDDAEDVDLDTLERLYQTAFEHRAAVKRQLAAHVPAKPKVIDMTLAGKSADTLAGQLKADQDRLQKCMSASATATRALADQEQAILTATALANEADKLDGAKQAHEQMLAEHQGRLAKAREDLELAKSQRAEPVDQLQAQARDAEVLIEKLARHDPDRGCVLSATIPCLTKATEFSGQVAELRKQMDGLATRIKAGSDRQAAITAAEQRIKDEDRTVTYHQGQLADGAKRIAAAADAAQRLKTLRAGLRDLKAAARAAATAVTEEHQVVQDVMSAWQTMVQYQSAMEAHQRATTARIALEEAVEQAEAQVALLGPKGIRLQVLDAAVQDFTDDINAALGAFGFSLSLQVDPWQVLVQINGLDEPIRFELLSKGQQMFTGLAFQIALAKVSGLDFLVIDDAEAVVGTHRRLMTGTVMTSDVGQILVSMAKGADEAVPSIAGLQVVRMDQ